MAASRSLARLRRNGTALVLVAGAAFAASSGASGATAVGSDVSSNWAGYVASAGLDPATGAAQAFSTASGNWVQPSAKCTTAISSTSAAFWVGLGGDSESSTALEQIGTESDCTAKGTARYSAWYELVPAGSVAISLKVSPGDKLAASVGVTGTKVSVKLANLTTGKSFSRILSMASPDTSSAEWIAEAPSLCASENESTCRQSALTNFGKISFSHASITSAAGHTGTISDPTWSATALELAGRGGGSGYGRFTAASAAAQALPGALKTSGSSFAVTWSNAQPQPDPGYGYDPGNGYGGGDGGGGYYGGGYPAYRAVLLMPLY